MRHLWAIYLKADTCALKKMDLRIKVFWRVKIPNEVRKIFHLRDLVQPWIKHLVGDGQSRILWFDNWHNLGP